MGIWPQQRYLKMDKELVLGITTFINFVVMVYFLFRYQVEKKSVTDWKHESNSNLADFQISEDNLATATAEYNVIAKAYSAMFCKEPGCPNVKYYTFNLCSTHVSESQGMTIEDNRAEPTNILITERDLFDGKLPNRQMMTPDVIERTENDKDIPQVKDQNKINDVIKQVLPDKIEMSAFPHTKILEPDMSNVHIVSTEEAKEKLKNDPTANKN